jgi:hypothetical protein
MDEQRLVELLAAHRPEPGSYGTRTLVLAPGESAQFDADADELLCIDLTGTDVTRLEIVLNRRERGLVAKGFWAFGRIRHVALTNQNANQATVIIGLARDLEVYFR